MLQRYFSDVVEYRLRAPPTKKLNRPDFKAGAGKPLGACHTERVTCQLLRPVG